MLFAAFLPAAASAQQPLALLDVPFISQSEALCGGAAAAMVLRYWGETGLTAETFAPLVDRSAAGIRTDALAGDVRARGFGATELDRRSTVIQQQLAQGRPIIALIEDRPGTFHYVVVVAWHDRGVVFHDPARAPFRVVGVEEFERRWARADRWALVVTRSGTPAPPPLSTAAPAPATSCDELVQAGVMEAQANNLDAAEQALTRALSCPGRAPLRELAGVRLLQRRWSDVEALASSAVAQDQSDAYAWKLLGTSRFVSSDTDAALDAWNRAGEPLVDLIRVDGLDRTRQRPIERMLAMAPNQLLTRDRLQRARRQIAELPAAARTGVTYVPASGGAAQVRVAVVERSLFPVTPIELAAIAIPAIASREIASGISSPSGGGERIVFGWRFWPDRPRYSLGIRTPAPWGGTLGVTGTIEEQPFTDMAVSSAHRSAIEVVVSRWMSGRSRIEAGGGMDRWRGGGTFAAIRSAYRFLDASERVDLRAEGRGWLGDRAFSTWQLASLLRSAANPTGFAVVGRAALSAASARVPLDQWPAGDSGKARPLLLRAHPLIDDGAIRTGRIGRTVFATSVEGQYWWSKGPLRVAPAVFIDAGRTSRRLSGDPITDFDTGVGLRARVPGLTGTLRLDAARGLRDGSTALSLVYEP